MAYEEEISYLPKNPNVSLKEANNSDKLYQTAEENNRAVIEVLLSPILDDAGYSIVW